MSILGDLTGSNAAKASKAAAADQYKKEQDSINSLLGYASGLPAQYAALGKGYDPYREAGTDALSMMRSGLGLGGDGQAFQNAYQSGSGYQAGMDAGGRQVAQRYNAGGMGQSGPAMKGLQQQGLLYDNMYRNQYLDRLMGLSGQGMQATGAQAGLGAQGLGAEGNLRQTAFGGQMGSARTIGQGDVAAAQARMQGTQGLLNAGLNGIGMLSGYPPTGLGRQASMQPSPNGPNTYAPTFPRSGSSFLSNLFG